MYRVSRLRKNHTPEGFFCKYVSQVQTPRTFRYNGRQNRRRARWKQLLQVRNLTGGYGRNKPVIHDITFEVAAGELIGLLGLNGAGKSTTMKHILGFMNPREGNIRIRNITLADNLMAYRQAYAYVPETPLLYDELTVREHLQLTAMAYGLPERTFKERSAELIERFQMGPHVDRLSPHLSKGMRQKVMIMNAFLVDPPLYIIDEPFVGLDPIGIRSLLELMLEVKKRGAAVLMSSHILSMLEKYCDRYIVLHQGRIRAEGTIGQLREHTGMQGASVEDVFYRLVQPTVPS